MDSEFPEYKLAFVELLAFKSFFNMLANFGFLGGTGGGCVANSRFSECVWDVFGRVSVPLLFRLPAALFVTRGFPGGVTTDITLLFSESRGVWLHVVAALLLCSEA